LYSALSWRGFGPKKIPRKKGKRGGIIMPASRFTKKAKTEKKKRQWQHVYDSMVASGKSKAAAIKAANAAVRG